MSNDNDIRQWFASHEKDYAAVMSRLTDVRRTVTCGPIQESAKVLERAYMFAVLSIKTERGRHETAFVGHYTGNLTRKEAALETVYGGNKKNWIRRTFDKTNWETLAIAVQAHARKGRYDVLLDVITDNLVGVSYRKASFMLAMSGLYEYACIDSNVERFGGIDKRESFNSADSYMDTVERVMSSTGIEDYPPFLIQWAIYDMERGEHASHMTYFEEISHA